MAVRLVGGEGPGFCLQTAPASRFKIQQLLFEFFQQPAVSRQAFTGRFVQQVDDPSQSFDLAGEIGSRRGIAAWIGIVGRKFGHVSGFQEPWISQVSVIMVWVRDCSRIPRRCRGVLETYVMDTGKQAAGARFGPLHGNVQIVPGMTDLRTLEAAGAGR